MVKPFEIHLVFAKVMGASWLTICQTYLTDSILAYDQWISTDYQEIQDLNLE